MDALVSRVQAEIDAPLFDKIVQSFSEGKGEELVCGVCALKQESKLKMC